MDQQAAGVDGRAAQNYPAAAERHELAGCQFGLADVDDAARGDRRGATTDGDRLTAQQHALGRFDLRAGAGGDAAREAAVGHSASRRSAERRTGKCRRVECYVLARLEIEGAGGRQRGTAYADAAARRNLGRPSSRKVQLGYARRSDAGTARMAALAAIQCIADRLDVQDASGRGALDIGTGFGTERTADVELVRDVDVAVLGGERDIAVDRSRRE